MQLSLFQNLPVDERYDIEDFIRSSSNKEAVLWVTRWPETLHQLHIASMPAAHAMMIYGPTKCGKTHLAQSWQKRLNAYCLEASEMSEAILVEKILNEKRHILLEGCHNVRDERQWFHVLNMVREAGVCLLMTSQLSIEQQRIELPDLRSRLNTVPAIEIEQPDEELAYMLLLRYCTMHQLNIDAKVMEYMAMRMKRSYQDIHAMMERLNSEALIKKRNITIPFIREIKLL